SLLFALLLQAVKNKDVIIAITIKTLYIITEILTERCDIILNIYSLKKKAVLFKKGQLFQTTCTYLSL
ncbi:hypothetical protein ABWK26_27100, partial [Bacillus toyonensis]|uniref:hypothetical protein n=1 Tax=Bacillus toyonensis TaxID=155322 RepID=UPI0033962CE7